MGRVSPARKQRLRERHAAEAAEEQRQCDALKAQGKSCAICLHSDRPGSLRGKMACQLDSDFQGYAITHPSNICSRFRARA